MTVGTWAWAQHTNGRLRRRDQLDQRLRAARAQILARRDVTVADHVRVAAQARLGLRPHRAGGSTYGIKRRAAGPLPAGVAVGPTLSPRPGTSATTRSCSTWPVSSTTSASPGDGHGECRHRPARRRGQPQAVTAADLGGEGGQTRPSQWGQLCAGWARPRRLSPAHLRRCHHRAGLQRADGNR